MSLQSVLIIMYSHCAALVLQLLRLLHSMFASCATVVMGVHCTVHHAAFPAHPTSPGMCGCLTASSGGCHAACTPAQNKLLLPGALMTLSFV
jgi:hypothetical protein